MAETKTTYCRICEATCGLVATVENGRVVSLAPDPEHVASRGYACKKGLAQHRVLHSPDRLLHPQKRIGDRWQRISWEQALEEIGAKVRSLVAAHGGDSVSFYLGNPIAFSLLPPILASGFLRGLGSRSFFQTGSQDCNNKFVVAQRMYGFPFVQPFPDVDRCRCLVIVGSNPAVSKMSFVQLPDPLRRLRAIERAGGHVFHVNPRRTETAKVVGEHVFIRPDTDVFFFLSFLHEVLARGAVATERVARSMRGLEIVRDVAAPFPPERTAEVTGIAPEVLRRMVDVFVRADGAALFSSTGVNQGSHGTLAFWLGEVINAITGNLDRPGGTLVGQGYVADFPKHARKAGQTMRTDRSRVGNLPSVVDTFPAGILADEILEPGPGRIRSLFVLSGNPVLSVPNPGGKLERALRELELLVAIDIFRNETGNLAHYLLPGTSALQRTDLPFVFQSLMGAQPVPYVQMTDAVVPPEAEQRDETSILVDLAAACGADLFGSRLVGALFRAFRAAERLPFVGERLALRPERLLELAARGFGFGGLEALRAHPHGKLLPPHRPGDFLGRRVVTDDGLVDLAPADLVAAASELEAVFAREVGSRTTLRLVSKREIHSHNSWFHNVEGFGAGERTAHRLYLHPADAEVRGVRDGELVEVSSAVGAVRVVARVTDEMMPGAVALPHGWGHGGADGLRVARQSGGANANLLAADGPESLERFSGMARLNGIPVDVRPVSSVEA